MVRSPRVHKVNQKDDSDSHVEYILADQNKQLLAIDNEGPIDVEMQV